LNFELLLLLNDDDGTWDYPKGRVLGRNKKFLDIQFWGRVKRAIGTL
jgi:hypothetical protein